MAHDQLRAAFALPATGTAVLAIDLQERFLGAIPDLAADQPCGRHARLLLTGACLLGVPAVFSEQYPKGLGPTLPWLAAAHPQAPRLAKTHFSVPDDPGLRAHLAGLGRRTLVLCGVEAHVCVLASAADLLAAGHAVVVAGDAVASRSAANRDSALAALRDLGALVLPTESILFRLQRQAGGETFKALSQLVK